MDGGLWTTLNTPLWQLFLNETRYSGLTRERKSLSTTVDSRLLLTSKKKPLSLLWNMYIQLQFSAMFRFEAVFIYETTILLLNKHTSNIKYVETISTGLCLRVLNLNEFHSFPFRHLQF